VRPRSEWPRETASLERELDLRARHTGTTVLALAEAERETSDRPIRCGALDEIIGALRSEIDQER